MHFIVVFAVELLGELLALVCIQQPGGETGSKTGQCCRYCPPFVLRLFLPMIIIRLVRFRPPCALVGQGLKERIGKSR